MDDLTKRELIELAERVFVQANALQSGVFFGRSNGVHPAHLNALLASETELRSIGRRLRSVVGESPNSTPMSGVVLDVDVKPLTVGIPAKTLVAWYNILQGCCRASFPTTKPLSHESIVLLYVECLERVQEFAENVLAQQIPPDLLEANDQPF